MLQDINQIFKYFRSEDGQNARIRIILFALIIFILIVINRYILIPHISDDYKIFYNQSKLFFNNGLSPYTDTNQNYLKGIAENEGWKLQFPAIEMEYPILQLIFYFPFTLIEDYIWSEAAFITTFQISIFFVLHLLFKMLKCNINKNDRIIIYFLSSASYFVVINMLSVNISVFQILFLVAAIYFDEQRNFILSGIFLGLLFVDPINAFYVIATLIIIFISKKRYTTLIWSFISLALMTLLTFVFNKKWILDWLKTLFLSPSNYPFLTFLDSASQKYSLQFTRIFLIIPILLISWALLEITRTPKNIPEQKIWLISFVGILNHYLMVQTTPNTAIFFLPSLVIILATWWEKINPNSKIVIFLGWGLITFGLFLIPDNIFVIINENILLFMGIILIVNLYWIRRWVINPSIDKSDIDIIELIR